MREMRCSPSLGEEYIEVVKHWLWNDSGSYAKTVQVNYMTQLLSYSAHSWWVTIRQRKAIKILS